MQIYSCLDSQLAVLPTVPFYTTSSNAWTESRRRAAHRFLGAHPAWMDLGKWKGPHSLLVKLWVTLVLGIRCNKQTRCPSCLELAPLQAGKIVDFKTASWLLTHCRDDWHIGVMIAFITVKVSCFFL